MAKLTKHELKALLKECLVEILSEEKILPALKESYLANSTTNVNSSNRPAAQETVAQKPVERTKNPVVMEHVNRLATQISLGGGDKNIFENILADTAMTTLQSQMVDPELKGGGGMSLPQQYTAEEQEQDKKLLEKISHGGDISHWAKLAFAKKD